MAIVASALPALVYGGALPAKAAAPDPSVRSLQRQLEQRDAVIEDLQRRVRELERRMGGAAEPATPEAATTGAAATAAPGEAPQAEAPTETPVPGEQEKAAGPPHAVEGPPAPAPG